MLSGGVGRLLEGRRHHHEAERGGGAVNAVIARQDADGDGADAPVGELFMDEGITGSGEFGVGILFGDDAHAEEDFGKGVGGGADDREAADIEGIGDGGDEVLFGLGGVGAEDVNLFRGNVLALRMVLKGVLQEGAAGFVDFGFGGDDDHDAVTHSSMQCWRAACGAGARCGYSFRRDSELQGESAPRGARRH